MITTFRSLQEILTDILAEPRKLRVYIAGPYTKGDVAVNVRNAILAGNYVAEIGHVPFIPHLSHFWHLVTPRDDIQFWYDQDMEWLKVCDALVRLEGESKGADEEVRVAEELGLPIYRSVFDIPHGNR